MLTVEPPRLFYFHAESPLVTYLFLCRAMNNTRNPLGPMRLTKPYIRLSLAWNDTNEGFSHVEKGEQSEGIGLKWKNATVLGEIITAEIEGVYTRADRDSGCMSGKYLLRTAVD